MVLTVTAEQAIELAGHRRLKIRAFAAASALSVVALVLAIRSGALVIGAIAAAYGLACVVGAIRARQPSTAELVYEAGLAEAASVTASPARERELAAVA